MRQIVVALKSKPGTQAPTSDLGGVCPQALQQSNQRFSSSRLNAPAATETANYYRGRGATWTDEENRASCRHQAVYFAWDHRADTLVAFCNKSHISLPKVLAHPVAIAVRNEMRVADL